MADLKDKFEKIPSLHPILQNFTDSHVIPPFSLGPSTGIESCFSRESLLNSYRLDKQHREKIATERYQNISNNLL